MHVEAATSQHLISELVARVHDGDIGSADAMWMATELSAAALETEKSPSISVRDRNLSSV